MTQVRNWCLPNALTVLFYLSYVCCCFAQNAADKNGKDNILFFSMAHEKAPAFLNATRVSQNTLYTPESRLGWLHDGPRGEGNENLVARLLKSNSTPPPDNMSAYCVFWRGGGKPLTFRVDVPDGEYKIWIYSGMFMGGRFFDTMSYQIKAGGTEAVNQICDRTSFLKRYFKEFDDSYEYAPDWTTETVYDKYVKNQSLALHSLTGVARDGHLDIVFSDLSPAAKTTTRTGGSILPINAIVICPAASLQDGEKEIQRIATERRSQFMKQAKLSTFADQNPLPEIPAEFQAVGYVPFIMNFMKCVYPNTIPLTNEIGKDLRMALAQGQRDIASFALHPLQDMRQVKVDVSQLKDAKGNIIDNDRIKLHWMRYMIQPLDYMRRTHEYRGVPVLMMDNKALDLKKGMNRQYVLEVTPSANAQPGDYQGTITITPSDAKPLVMNLTVKVYPFTLETYPDDDERVWLYYADGEYKFYGDLLFASPEARWERIDKDLAFMKQQLIAPTLLFNHKAANDEIEKFMSLYVRHGFKGYGVFGDYALIGLVDKFKDPKFKLDIEADPVVVEYLGSIKNVLEFSKGKNWPKLAFYTFAEIHSGMPGYLAAKDILAKIKKQSPEAALITLPNTVAEANVMITTQADIVGPNAVSMTEDVVENISKAGKKLWFYGWGRNRFRCGLVDWRLRNRGAIKEWYTYTAGAPFNPIDGNGQDAGNDAPPFVGPNGPVSTLGMEEATAGRIDFMYLATLELWMERVKAKNTPLAAKAMTHAGSIVEDLKGRIMPDYLYYYNRLKATDFKKNQFEVDKEFLWKWKDAEYDLYRTRIAVAITAMKNACDGIDTVPPLEKQDDNAQASAGKTSKKSEAFTTDSTGALRLTDDDFIDAKPAWSPNGSMVSYVSRRKGKDMLVLVNLNDKTEKVLPAVISKNSYHNWSPLGDKIAYTMIGKDGDIVAFTAIADLKTTAVGPGRNPAFSPDGKQLAYFSGKDILNYDLSTGKPANITSQQSEGELERLHWSADGNSIYYSKDGNLWRVSADGNANEMILDRSATGQNPPGAIENPLPLPDNSKVYVTINIDGLFAHASNNQLAALDMAGKKFTKIVDANSWTIAPDGKRIVYAIGPDLMLLDAVSGKKKKLTQGSEPMFSPKGDKIIYLHRKTMLEEPDVWVMDAP